MPDTENLITAATVAAALDGAAYPFNPSRQDQEAWKGADLFVICGASDDLVEIYGVDREEVGGPGSFLLGRAGPCRPWSEVSGELDDWASDDQVVAAVEPWLAARRNAVKIESTWCPPSGESWLITAEGVGGAAFNIMEDGEIFCRGLVLTVANFPAGT